MAPQDSFIDDDEECCPLCVEEFDLSDRNFRPCPCGYQICQFCFNNIRNNLSGLCPACRRPYDDKTIEWKAVSSEEMAQHRAQAAKQAKKKAEVRQKELQKREVESANRKHLQGLRVVQKNLVYVLGLSPSIQEDQILQTLRGDKYFGQYGKIIKIVVSKAKPNDTSSTGASLGVYVTFARKEDAARCIAAVNGSQNGDRILRAQLGTTKYCSAYLRNEICNNKQCMFLHEPGDNDDSYSRQDLSSINSANTQRPLPPSGTSSRQAALVQAPIAQAQPVSAATQPMVRENSNQDSEGGDSSALPSSASWANKGIQQRSRRGSHATSGAAASPAVSLSMPATTEVVEEVDQFEAISEPSPPPEEPTLVADPPRPQRDPLLVQLLKAINSPAVAFARPAVIDEANSYPPLFDDNGGSKRRAMREQQEESRLHLDDDSQTDLRSITEPLEEEQHESGSFQLGGEPEDRDVGRNGELAQNFQRRPSSQLPIQRGSSAASLGGHPGQNFNPNLSQLTSINGRALTPLQQQQIQLMKSAGQQPQSNFPDQYPPGIGNQPTLFQPQGHNRQSSRFGFNDGSATSIKASANPKLMAQQASMMPSSSHAQSGGQFFGSSMPGPPPGLKSSGTPPIGGMFSQGQSFGSATSFGGMSKDGQSEMLREMLRSRGAVGGSQAHDASKREYMFPSFLNQYPPSSTPAPASGLLASLYGPQTGAFHDFGQKQKKKGKKHRHANTSSSGGGGLVDVADPSILHARMQHQQQSNAGVGQVFGGQGQDDLEPPSVDDDLSNSMKSNVEALLAGSFDDDVPSQSQADFGFGSRSSTPSVPPGFETTHGHPAPAFRQDSPPKPPSKMIATSAEFTPSRVRAATPLSQVSVPTSPVQAFVNKANQSASALQARVETKALATTSGLSKEIAAQASKPALQAVDFPALDSGKGKGKASDPPNSTASLSASPTIAHRKVPTGPSGNAQFISKIAEKKVTPGILNIPAPQKQNPKTPGASEMANKPVVNPAEFPALTPSIPLPVLPKPTPKTLKISAPTKVEAQITTPLVTPSSTTSAFLPHISTSRQPSTAPMPRVEDSATPTSEVISDNVSLTDTSISRANSPPPTRIGSAPVRENTKSMQKKARVQRAKEKAEQEAAASTTVKAEPGVVEVAPVMGRKKKQKKDRIVSNMTTATATSTPSASRAPSPGPSKKEESGKTKESPEETLKATEKTVPEPVVTKPDTQSAELKGKGKVKAQPAPVAESSLLPPPVVESEATEKPLPTPASILQELVSGGEIPPFDNIGLLKPLTLSSKPQDIPIDMQSANQKLTITPEDRAALLSGKPVHKIAEGPNRIMLTPNGDCIRNLSEDEEQRYLELQARIAAEAGPTTFISSKYHTGNGFTLIGGRAVPNGLPSFFPSAIMNAPSMDPVSKIQRDEALSYINQYVLPSLSSNTQLEKALNANALDKSLLHSPIDASNWAQWGHDILPPSSSSHPETSVPSGTPNPESMLGLESITAHFAVASGLSGAGAAGGSVFASGSGSVGMLSVGEAESALQLARKEAEAFEKRFNALLKKNRKLLLGSGH